MPHQHKPNTGLYETPDISLFENFERGLIWHANEVVASMEVYFHYAEHVIANIEQGRHYFYYGEETLSPFFRLYASLAEADEAIRRLKTMSEEDLDKHFKLDGPCDIEKLEMRFKRIFKYTAVLEKVQPLRLQDGLNHEMEMKLNEWKNQLVWASKDSDRPYDRSAVDQKESINYFSKSRGELEYFRRAIHGVRHDFVDDVDMSVGGTCEPVSGRLPTINIDQYEARLLELDEGFRKVLRNRRAEESYLWTDQEFWWDHP